MSRAKLSVSAQTPHAAHDAPHRLDLRRRVVPRVRAREHPGDDPLRTIWRHRLDPRPASAAADAFHHGLHALRQGAGQDPAAADALVRHLCLRCTKIGL